MPDYKALLDACLDDVESSLPAPTPSEENSIATTTVATEISRLCRRRGRATLSTPARGSTCPRSSRIGSRTETRPPPSRSRSHSAHRRAAGPSVHTVNAHLRRLGLSPRPAGSWQSIAACDACERRDERDRCDGGADKARAGCSPECCPHSATSRTGARAKPKIMPLRWIAAAACVRKRLLREAASFCAAARSAPTDERGGPSEAVRGDRHPQARVLSAQRKRPYASTNQDATSPVPRAFRGAGTTSSGSRFLVGSR